MYLLCPKEQVIKWQVEERLYIFGAPFGSRIGDFSCSLGHDRFTIWCRVQGVRLALMEPLYRLAWQKGLVRFKQGLFSMIYPPVCLLCGDDGVLINGDVRDLCEACHKALQLNKYGCLRCGIPLQQAGAVCGSCLKKPPPFESLFTPYLYRGGIKELLVSLKFNRKLAHARLLGELMGERLANHLTTNDRIPDAIVPVPLHPGRQRERGYNQALELVRPLAKRLNIPINHHLVVRKAETVKQTKLSADERRRNLKGAFALREGCSVPSYLVIFDDVVTTGTTVTELAKTLKRAGAKRIDVWAVARVPKPGD